LDKGFKTGFYESQEIPKIVCKLLFLRREILFLCHIYKRIFKNKNLKIEKLGDSGIMK
jgi:hypothetical protein